MLRSFVRAGSQVLRGSGASSTAASRAMSSHVEETPEQFDQRYIDFFNRTDLDGWMVRKGMVDLHNADVIPEPKIVSAALRACRRVNDFALAVRFLEALKIKCGPKKLQDTVYPWLIQEVKPVLDELGISTPEELGYDKPELFHPSIDFWEHKFYEEYGYGNKRDRYTF